MRALFAAAFGCWLAIAFAPVKVAGQPPKPTATVEPEGRPKPSEKPIALTPADRPVRGLPPGAVAPNAGFEPNGGMTLCLPYPPETQANPYVVIGAPRGSRLEYLTWERVYTLALDRHRSGGSRKLAAALDLAALNNQATRAHASDFARFRADFLGKPAQANAAAFADPGTDYFKILYQISVVDHSWRNQMVYKNLQALVDGLVDDLSGLNRLDLELVRSSLTKARNRYDESVAKFRDQLDELKVALGLSPSAAVFPDRSSVAAFSDVFLKLDDWVRSTEINPAELPKLAEKFPSLGDVSIEGQPIFGKIAESPDRLEEFLAQAVRVASRSRGGGANTVDADSGDVVRELSIRRRVRRLSDLRARYATEKQTYVRIWRLKQHAFERMVAPRSETPSSRSPMLETFISQQAELLETENRLVSIWTSFQAERLALYREIGVFPYDSWNAFYSSLAAPIPAAKPVRVAPGVGLTPAEALP